MGNRSSDAFSVRFNRRLTGIFSNTGQPFESKLLIGILISISCRISGFEGVLTYSGMTNVSVGNTSTGCLPDKAIVSTTVLKPFDGSSVEKGKTVELSGFKVIV